MFKVYNNMAPEYLCKKFLIMRSTYDTRGSSTSSCLFPKPIMAKKVLATGPHLFGINYQRICVDAKKLYETKLDRLVPSFFDSIL